MLVGFAENQARAHGFEGWIEYLHRHSPKAPA